MVVVGGNGSQMWVTAEFHRHFLVSDADWGWPWTSYMFQGGDDGWGGRLTSPDNRHLLVYVSQRPPNIMSEILRHRSHKLDREATLPALRMYSTYPRTKVTRWRIWLRHWAVSRKAADSILDGVIEIFIDIILRLHYSPGFDSASNINEYHEYFLGDKGGRCVGLTTLTPPFADCLEIWEPMGL
jgi:hypothetical protein